MITGLQEPAINDKVLGTFESKLGAGDLGRTTKEQMISKVRDVVLEKASEMSEVLSHVRGTGSWDFESQFL